MPAARTVIVHDYAGHPFQVELSRYLAKSWTARGIRVVHSFSSSTHTPQANLKKRGDDPENLDIVPIDLGRTINKYQFVDRFRMERQYGKNLVALCESIRPEAVLSGNTPTMAQLPLVQWCNHNNARVVTWIQDMYGVAAYKILKKKFSFVGGMAGRYLMHLDKKSYRQSECVVPITEDFRPILKEAGVAEERIVPIHNWAPLDDLPVHDRENEWSQSTRLKAGVRFIYSGTLSIRHNPSMLLDLAKSLEGQDQAELIVISEGDAADWLREEGQGLQTLRVLPFQPFDQLPQVLAAADVLIGILEPDAGVFCVPSKILTYLCAGRSLLTAIPEQNLAARLVQDVNAGFNSAPDDSKQFIENAKKLIANPEKRAAMGSRARAYAEKEFDIRSIASRFAEVLAIPL